MFVIGDVHGHIGKLFNVLNDAGLIDRAGNWSGGQEALWFLGDYFDRGPDGIAVVELIMNLQNQADAAGGHVGALLGNHDVLTLAAYQFGKQPSGGPGGSFQASWEINGGNPFDLERLQESHIDWLKSLPAMALVADRLLAHADATFYQIYGQSIRAVNHSISMILNGREPAEWDLLLDYFSQRRAFQDGEMGQARVHRFMTLYGGCQFIHGHTPVCKVTGQKPEEVRSPLIYAGGLAVDVDPGLYLGGPGFAFRPVK